ncbi:uncharacterized protein LOC113850913 [Abrus precatorius]|uniref:Uncharacterized protein LOC113850913 n=1 Tax=Abrus precatorius TaxID=3816 RepID=A0A8B8K0Q9_ABRPR|nr:uncharacterized protein LOC113850913 [Abrus precatorius]
MLLWKQNEHRSAFIRRTETENMISSFCHSMPKPNLLIVPILEQLGFAGVAKLRHLKGFDDDEEATYLKLFPFSLIRKAKEWLKSHPNQSLTNWSDVERKFLTRFFPPYKFEDVDQLNTFCNGLRPDTKMILDAAADGTMMVVDAEQATRIINALSSTDRKAQHNRRIYERVAHKEKKILGGDSGARDRKSFVGSRSKYQLDAIIHVEKDWRGMTLQLADRSMKFPYGVVKDVLVKVDKFGFLVDFIIMDTKKDVEVSLILGRPFMKTTKVIIDVDDAKLKTQLHKSSQLEKALIEAYQDLNKEEEKEIEDCLKNLESSKELPLHEAHHENFPQEEKIEEQKLGLKMLSLHLKYVFLENGWKKPIVSSSALSKGDEEKLILVLKANEGAIRWTLSDLKGISPSYCKHKIHMKVDFKPVAQPQRHLNPTMKEVVKKEMMKLVDAGMIYPISDSVWATRKDHFPLPFMNQMLERLARQALYCFWMDTPDLVEKCIEVFIDDFSVFGSSFEDCLTNPDTISSKGIEVDKEKVEVIKKLPPPINVKGIRSFLRHVGFYRRFIKDFSKIAKPLSNLINKDTPCNFDVECLYAFELLKQKLISSPVIVAPDWNLDFELKCDASDYAVGPEFDLVMKDKKGSEKFVADHLSRLVNQEVTNKEIEVIEEFLKEKLLLDDPHLFKLGADGLLRRCVALDEIQSILCHCHSPPYDGHFNGERIAAKVLKFGFYWPTLFKYAQNYVQQCTICQKSGRISRRHEMPLSSILKVEVFDCWGIDFVGPLPASYSNEYILVAVDYISKWVEAIAF